MKRYVISSFAALFMAYLTLNLIPVSGINDKSQASTTLSKEYKMEESIMMVMETNRGTIKIKLFPQVAPKTCENFVGLAQKGYYNGVSFHRVIKDFMIQGGDPDGNGTGGASLWGSDFEDECSKDVNFDREGLLAMANRGPNTNGSQFFITTAKTPWLHMNHTIFGEIVEGMDVVREIEDSQTDRRDMPVEPQTIVKLYKEEAAIAAR